MTKEKKRIYGNCWYELKANERLMIEDAYFNSPRLVRSSTNFYQYIIDYIRTRDVLSLKGAVKEIKERSNPSNLGACKTGVMPKLKCLIQQVY